MRFGLFPFRSPLLMESQLLSLPTGTEMFHFPAFARIRYLFTYTWYLITGTGFPHSDISESPVICTSSELFAAYHVLHRLLWPRHPPWALRNLTIPCVGLMVFLVSLSSIVNQHECSFEKEHSAFVFNRAHCDRLNQSWRWLRVLGCFTDAFCEWHPIRSTSLHTL